MSFRILGTNHTSFTVSNLERTIAFLHDCLGFEVVSKAPRDPALVSRITGVEGADMMIAFLKAPGHTLELIEYRAPANKGAVKARPCDTGFRSEERRVGKECRSRGSAYNEKQRKNE